MTHHFDPALPSPPRNAPALWALILGITALALSLSVIGGALGLIAAILSVIGLLKPGRKGMAITGIITGIVSLGIAFIAFVPITTGKVEQARRTHTAADLSDLKAAVFAFEVDTGHFPTTAEGLDALLSRPAALTPAQWHGPYIANHQVDPWGHPFIYLYPGKTNPTGFDLSSAGPDGLAGTPDDMTLH